MIITEKMIRELQKRVDLSYEEAERFLKRAGGNIDLAEAYAYKRANSFMNRLVREIEKLIAVTMNFRLQVYREEDLFVNVPLLAFGVLIVLIGFDQFLLVSVVGIVFALVANCSIHINKSDKESEFKFYRTVNKEDRREYSKQRRNTRRSSRKHLDKSEVMDKIDSSTSTDAEFSYETDESHIDKGEASVNGSLTDNQGPIEKGEYLHNDDDDDYYEVTIDK